MAETWTIKRCLDWTRDYLKDHGADRARFEAELLLSSATGLSRMDMYLDFERPLASEELALMHGHVVRRVKGEPLQYITGGTQFRTLEIACEPGVLIPRPETEVLVEEVLAFLDAEVLGPNRPHRDRVELPWSAEVEEARRAEEAAARRAGEEGAEDEPAGPAAERIPGPEDNLAPMDAEFGPMSEAPADGAPTAAEAPAAPRRTARVLEVGCGTGCISLSLAAERSGSVSCVATDIEPRAVELATRNRGAVGIDPAAVDFRLGDLVAPVGPEEAGAFDVLVSNPPYIPEAVMATIPREVSAFEPSLALVSGADGLDMFRRILAVAPQMLRPGGLLACELYEGALEAAASLCHAAGFRDVRIVQDLTRRPRIVLARRP